MNVYSAFSRLKWETSNLFTVLIGGRAVKHNFLEEPIFIPSINLKSTPWEKVDVRVGYAQGYRAPQAFNEDLHIENVGGNIRLIQLSNGLKPELSESYSASITYNGKTAGKGIYELSVEGFYNILNDQFILEEEGVNNKGHMIMKKRNGTGSFVRGASFQAKYAPSGKFEFQAGMTVQQNKHDRAVNWSENEELATKNFLRTPNTYGYFLMNSTPVHHLTLSLSGNYTGRMYVQHYAGYIKEDRLERTNDFMELNFKSSYEIHLKEKLKLKLNAGVQNFLNSYQQDFDNGMLRDPTYIYGPSRPRTYFVGVSLEY